MTAVGVDGASNVADQDPQGADGEVLLDIEVVGSVAPGAVQLVYFAPNTDQGFVDAVTDAVHAEPTPVAVSISWGGPESSWTAQSMTALDAGHRRRRRARRDCYRGGGRQRQRRRGHRRPAAHRLPGLQPARAGMRRHQPAGRCCDQHRDLGDRLERRQRRRDRRRRQRDVRPADLAGQRRRPGEPGRRPGSRRARRRRQRRPRHWLPGADRRTADGDRRHQRRRAAVGRADRPPRAVARQAARPRAAGRCTPASSQAAGSRAAGHHQGSNGAYSAGPGWDACTGLGVPRTRDAAPVAHGLPAHADSGADHRCQ